MIGNPTGQCRSVAVIRRTGRSGQSAASKETGASEVTPQRLEAPKQGFTSGHQPKAIGQQGTRRGYSREYFSVRDLRSWQSGGC